MEGQGVVEMDHPEYYNSGKGNLVNTMKDPKKAPRGSKTPFSSSPTISPAPRMNHPTKATATTGSETQKAIS